MTLLSSLGQGKVGPFGAVQRVGFTLSMAFAQVRSTGGCTNDAVALLFGFGNPHIDLSWPPPSDDCSWVSEKEARHGSCKIWLVSMPVAVHAWCGILQHVERSHFHAVMGRQPVLRFKQQYLWFPCHWHCSTPCNPINLITPGILMFILLMPPARSQHKVLLHFSELKPSCACGGWHSLNECGSRPLNHLPSLIFSLPGSVQLASSCAFSLASHCFQKCSVGGHAPGAASGICFVIIIKREVSPYLLWTQALQGSG